MPLVIRTPLLLFLILLTALYPGSGYSQQMSQEDSLQIEQYATQLNRNLIETPGDSIVYTDEIIDSLLNEYRMGYGGGKVHYAPDSAFKIYIIEGSGGGLYGNEIYHTYLHFKNGKRLNLEEDIDPVTGIYKTAAFTYMVLQHYWSRSGSAHTEEYYAVTQFSVEKDSIQYMSLKCTDKWPFYPPDQYDNNFTIYTYHNYANPGTTYMRYDPKTKRLSYRFMVGRGQAELNHNDQLSLFKNENQVLQVTGSCVLKNGLLQFAGEKFKIVDWKEKNE
ncbi:MAG TPA: hypothetical protein VF008_11465 [Niastella sp.]